LPIADWLLIGRNFERAEGIQEMEGLDLLVPGKSLTSFVHAH
jgi:hypothetical protein